MTKPNRPYAVGTELAHHTETVHIRHHLMSVHPRVSPADSDSSSTCVEIASNLAIQSDRLEVLDALAAAFTAAAAMHREWEEERDARRQRAVRFAAGRLLARAPSAARRAMAGLESGVVDEVALSLLTAVVLPPDLEADREIVLAALRSLADVAPAVQS